MKVRITEQDIIDLTLARGINLRNDTIYVYYGKDDILTYLFDSNDEARMVFDNIEKITGTETVESLARVKKRVAKKLLEDLTLDPKSEELFKQFWNTYDKKMSRTEAVRSWGSMTREEQTAAIPRAKAYRDSCEGRIKFMKHPATWLNQRCWEDVIIPKDSSIISREDKKAQQPKYNKPKYIKDDR